MDLVLLWLILVSLECKIIRRFVVRNGIKIIYNLTLLYIIIPSPTYPCALSSSSSSSSSSLSYGMMLSSWSS